VSRTLKAIIKWSHIGGEIKIMEGFTLPRRTKVNFSVPIPPIPKPPGVTEEITVLISSYTCMDCGFETESYGIMEDHQKSHIR